MPRQDIVSRCFAPLRKRPCWLAQSGYGACLTFEFGNPRLFVREPFPPRSGRSPAVQRMLERRDVYPRGGWHLWIYCCHWRILEGGHQLAHSESSDGRIDRAVARLNGQIIREVIVDPATGNTVFGFDLGGRLETTRSKRKYELWMLYRPSGFVLTVRGDGSYKHQHGASHRPGVWRRLPKLPRPISR